MKQATTQAQRDRIQRTVEGIKNRVYGSMAGRQVYVRDKNGVARVAVNNYGSENLSYDRKGSTRNQSNAKAMAAGAVG